MEKRNHYVPRISRFLVCALYHEGKRRGSPMTRLVDDLLTDVLYDSPGWRLAEKQLETESNTAPDRRDRPLG
jgi:hypothetical protein